MLDVVIYTCNKDKANERGDKEMRTYELCFRNSKGDVIDKISFSATYNDALKLLSIATIGFSEEHFPVYAELNIGEKHIAFYEITVR